VKAKFDAQAQREPLSPRELETLQLIVDGLINKEIGARLGIADGTVKMHVAKVLAKLGAADRTRAAILAVERGIVRLK
jgi:two-component system NarL family response regulator